MKLESLNSGKLEILSNSQLKTVLGGTDTGYNRPPTGRSKTYESTLPNGTTWSYTLYEYNLYTKDSIDSDGVITRSGHYGTNWNF